MYLTESSAIKLFELGFKRAEYYDNYNPYDVYGYKGEEWILGGRILPTGDILSPEKIYYDGIWLPTLSDLIVWLEENHCFFDMSYSKSGYKVKAKDENEKEYSGKGATAEAALFNAITKILKIYGGNPVNKKYHVEHAKFLGENT